MKIAAVSQAILGMMVLVSTVSCGPPQLSKIEPSEPVPPIASREMIVLPVNRILKDNAGRKIDVTIVGKDSTTVTFRKRIDGSHHTVSIGTLSSEDQDFLKRVADKEARHSQESTESPAQLGSIGDMKRKELADLEREISELQKSLYAPDVSKFVHRRNVSRLNQLNNERTKLVAEIADLEDGL